MNDAMTPDEREAKLAGWTRSALAHLRRRVRDAEKYAEEARLETKPEESDTVIVRFTADDIGLGTGTIIRFWPKGRDHDYIDVNVRHGELRVSGQSRIFIQPSASNSMFVTVD